MHGCCMGPGLMLKLACLCVGASSAGDVKCRSQELNCDWCRDATNCGGCIGMCAGGACLGALAAALPGSRHGCLRARHRAPAGYQAGSGLRLPTLCTRCHPNCRRRTQAGQWAVHQPAPLRGWLRRLQVSACCKSSRLLAHCRSGTGVRSAACAARRTPHLLVGCCAPTSSAGHQQAC